MIINGNDNATLRKDSSMKDKMLMMRGPTGNKEKVRQSDMSHYLGIGYTIVVVSLIEEPDKDAEGTDDEAIKAAELTAEATGTVRADAELTKPEEPEEA